MQNITRQRDSCTANKPLGTKKTCCSESSENRPPAKEAVAGFRLADSCWPQAARSETAAGENIAGQRCDPSSTTSQTAPELRPYQVDVIDRVEAEIAAGHRRVLIVAPT